MMRSSIVLLLLLAACSDATSPGESGASAGSAQALAASDPDPTGTCTVPQVTITHSAGTVGTGSVKVLDAQDAICNDGTPGVYIFRPGTGVAAKRWIIDLEGGGACYDQASCQARSNNDGLVGSGVWQDYEQPEIDGELNGVLSPDPTTNPDFFDATVVKVHYCSSDSWSGAKNKTGTGTFSGDDVTTWNFQGRKIGAAVIADLKKKYGFNDATEVMFIGHSAGAAGVYVNVNDMVTQVPKTARFVASGDAAFNIDITGFDPNAPPNYTSDTAPRRSDSVLAAESLWGGRGDRKCDAVTTTPEQKTNCYSPPALFQGGAITFPMYVAQAQRDHVQISGNISEEDQDAPKAAIDGYTAWFATQMHAALLALPANVTVFAPNTISHTMATGDGIFNAPRTFGATTTSDRAALGAWYANPCAPHRYIESL